MRVDGQQIEIGTRLWAKDLGGDTVPRGGIVMAVLEESQQVIVSRGYTAASNNVRKPEVKTDTIGEAEIDPATITTTTSSERVGLARALLRVIGSQRSSMWGESDDRHMNTVAELLRV